MIGKRRCLQEWLTGTEGTAYEINQSKAQEQFMDLPLEDFLRYCQGGDWIDEICFIMELDYYPGINESLMVKDVTLEAERKIRLNGELEAAERRAVIDVLIRSFWNVMPEDYIIERRMM